MYQSPHYRRDDPAFTLSFIKEHPFATLICQGERLVATHIPLLVGDVPQAYVLEGHIALHNPMASYLQNQKEVLAVFQGLHGYISSSWYSRNDISTWDYSAVHVYGKIKLQSQQELLTSLKNLVAHFEDMQEHPHYMADLDPQMIEENIVQIIGFVITPITVEGIVKMSQNRSREDVFSIVKKLEQKNCPFSALLAEKIRKENDSKN